MAGRLLWIWQERTLEKRRQVGWRQSHPHIVSNCDYPTAHPILALNNLLQKIDPVSRVYLYPAVSEEVISLFRYSIIYAGIVMPEIDTFNS